MAFLRVAVILAAASSVAASTAGTCATDLTNLAAHQTEQLRLLQVACANDAACAAAMSCNGGIELTPAQLTIAPRAVAVAQAAAPGAVCKSQGDPHLKSFVKNADGSRMKYDFQMKGLYWLVYSPEIKIQVRQCPWSLPGSTSARVSGNSAVAIQYMDGEVITIKGANTRDDKPTVTVGPSPTAITGSDSARGISGAGSNNIKFDLGGYTVSVHKTNGIFLNLVVAVPAGGVPWVNPGQTDEIDLAVMSGLCVSIAAARHVDSLPVADILDDDRDYNGIQCVQDAWPPSPPPAIATPEPDAQDGTPMRQRAEPACAGAGDDAADCVVDVLHAVELEPDIKWREEVVEPAIKAKLIEDVLVRTVEPPPPPPPATVLAPAAPPPTPGGACSSSGDPHFTSFTGERFDFQMKGTYWLVYSADFKVQVRQCPWSLPKSLSSGVSGNTAVAIQYKSGPIITVLGGQNTITEGDTPSVCVTPAGVTPQADCAGGVLGDDPASFISGHDTNSVTFATDGYKVTISKTSRVFMNVNVAVPEGGIKWEATPTCGTVATTDGTAECPKGCSHTPGQAATACATLSDPDTNNCQPGCERDVTAVAGAVPVEGNCEAGYTLGATGACEKFTVSCSGNTLEVEERCIGTANPFTSIDTSEGTGMLGLCVSQQAARIADQWNEFQPSRTTPAPADILFDGRAYDPNANSDTETPAESWLECPEDSWPPAPTPSEKAVPPEPTGVREAATPPCAAAGIGADDCITDVLFAVEADTELTEDQWLADIVEPTIKVNLIQEAEQARVAPPLRSFILAESTKAPLWSCVRAEVTLEKDIHDVAGTTGTAAFEKEFKKDVAQILGCPESQVSIERVNTAASSTNCVVAFNVRADGSGNAYDTSELAAAFSTPRDIAGARSVAGAQNIGMVSCATLAATPFYDVPDGDWSIWDWLLLLLLLLLLCCCGFFTAYFCGQRNGRNEAVNQSEFLDLVMQGDGDLQDKEQIALAQQQVSEGIDDHTRSLFEQMDADKSGTLTKDEIMTLVAAENLPVDPKYVDGVISAYDTDQSGDLNLEEFAAMHNIIQRKAGEAKLASRSTSRLSLAVNYMEQKTGWDIDRDGDVGVAGRADTGVSKGWREQLDEAKARVPPVLPGRGGGAPSATEEPTELETFQVESKRDPPPLASLRGRTVPSSAGADESFGAVGLPTPQRPQTPERRSAPALPAPAAGQTDDRDPLGLGLGINQSGRSVRAAVPDSDKADIEIGASVRGMAMAFNDGVAAGATLSELQQGESMRGSKLKLELPAPTRRPTTPPRLTSPSVGI